MSISTIDVVMKRITTARNYSPISVFIPHDAEPYLFEAVFFATSETQRRIKSNDPLYIGTFDRTMPKETVMNKLQQARRERK